MYIIADQKIFSDIPLQTIVDVVFNLALTCHFILLLNALYCESYTPSRIYYLTLPSK